MRRYGHARRDHDIQMLASPLHLRISYILALDDYGYGEGALLEAGSRLLRERDYH